MKNDILVLVEPMIPALRRYARALLRDRHDADDLVQDCLERVIGRWHLRREDADARPWVFTILHNLAVNHLMKVSRRGRHLPIDDVEEQALGRPAPQEHHVHHRDLLAALELLPDEQRSVLLLVSVEDLSYAQAASVLNIPIGTVMSRLVRAREKLERLLEGGASSKPGASLRRVK